MIRLLVIGSLALVAEAGSAQAAAAIPSRVLTIDWGKGSIALIDTANGQSVATFDVEGKTDGLDLVLPSPDGSRIVVGHKTPMKGIRPLAKSSITLLDAQSLKPVSKVELGWGLQVTSMRAGREVWSGASFQFDGDGRLLALFPGYRAKKPEEALPAEIISIDLATGAIVSRVEFEKRITRLEPGSATGTMLAILGADDLDSKKATPIDLRWVDLAKLEVVGRATVPGNETPRLAAGGDVFISEFMPSSTGRKTRVHLISGGSFKEIAAVDLDGTVIEVVPGAEGRWRALVDLEAGKGGPDGRLHLLIADRVERSVDLAAPPRFTSADQDGRRIYAVCKKALVRLDASLGKIGELETDGDEPKSIAFDAGSQRAFLLYEGSSKVTTIDLEKGAALATVKTGRGSVKFGNALMAAQARNTLARYDAAGLGKVFLVSSAANARATLAGIRPADTDIVLHPDHKFAYVLNQNTSDVTIIDQATGSVADKVGISGDSLRLFGERHLAALSSGGVRLLELETNKPVEDKTLNQIRETTLSADGDVLAGFVKNGIAFVDVREAKILATQQLAEPKRAGYGCTLVLPPTPKASVFR